AEGGVYAAMIQQVQVTAYFHAVLSPRHAHGDLAEGARRGRRDRLAAQHLEAREPLLPEEHERTPIHPGGDIDDVRAGECRRDRGGSALVNIESAGVDPLPGGGGTEFGVGA